MEPIINQLCNTHGWTRKYALEVRDEYLKFMELRYYNPKLSPSNEIDRFWHQHILNTRNYADFCRRTFGSFIHHDVEDAVDQPARRRRLAKTIEEYEKSGKYGKVAPANIWNKRPSIKVQIIYTFDTYEDGKLLGKYPKPNSGHKYDRKTITIPITDKTTVGSLKNYVANLVDWPEIGKSVIEVVPMHETDIHLTMKSRQPDNKLLYDLGDVKIVMNEVSYNGFC